MTSRTVLSLAVRALALALLTAGSAAAAPITSVTDLNSFRDTRGLNDVGIAQGDSIQFGANVVPNGAAGTTMQASQGATVRPAFRCQGLAVNVNFCASTVPFSDTLLGAWTLTFRNGPDSVVVTTPDLSLLPPGDPSAVPPVPSPPVPFPVSVTITGTGVRPTISFVVPDGFSPSAIRFNIYDKDDRLPNGQANVIHTEGASGSRRSFTVPEVLASGRRLQEGGKYALNIQLIETRDPAVPFTNQQAQILRRSSSFFTFTPCSGDDCEQAAFLPTVGPDGVYRFQVAGVQAGEMVFIDPLVAVGYKYATGPGDPNFESVRLPAVGDGIFTVRFPSGNATVEEAVQAGRQFFFPSGGVAAFDVLGIETSAGLDPANVTAFVTGVTFVADGAFTGTMTPVTRNIDHPLLTAPSSAQVWIGLKNSDDVGTHLDLKAEMYTGGQLVGSGQVDRVGAGSSGFNNARLSSIPLSIPDAPVELAPGTVMSLKLSARITCAGQTHASGTARLWLDDGQAASRIDATIDEIGQRYFLRRGSALASTQGAGPKATIDTFLDSKVACSKPGGRPFTSFGTWSIALP